MIALPLLSEGEEGVLELRVARSALRVEVHVVIKHPSRAGGGEYSHEAGGHR